MDAIDEIKQLYYKTTKTTILDDFARAIDLLKTLPDEAARERAAVYMEGLAEMRREWGGGSGPGSGHRGGGSGKATTRPSRK